MVRIGVMGATGYTGLELLKMLAGHPEVQVTALTSRQPEPRPIGTVHPELNGRLEGLVEQLDIDKLVAETDCVFSCLPHAASAETVQKLADRGVRVVDFSADYRLTDRALYERVYEVTHPDPGRIGKVPYGLPELFRSEIAGAPVVANPGCFPTCAILALAPLLKTGLIAPEGIICDAKSGVSGAGRNPKLALHFPECNESIAAYKLGDHRHGPEIDQVLSGISRVGVDLLFVPHLVPMNRGILTTAYAQPTAHRAEEDYFEALQEFYRDEPFVRVVPHLPATRHVRGTNFCDIAVRQARGRVVVVAAIDNLLKGASGAAVQNMNVMYGFPETTALP